MAAGYQGVVSPYSLFTATYPKGVREGGKRGVGGRWGVRGVGG